MREQRVKPVDCLRGVKLTTSIIRQICDQIIPVRIFAIISGARISLKRYAVNGCAEVRIRTSRHTDIYSLDQFTRCRNIRHTGNRLR